ncbi:MAG: polyprenyl synthetase family protein [Bacteroidetes bacterium]|nr:polyprenyl synthetase family protein [Bacteroidota bacterium]
MLQNYLEEIEKELYTNPLNPQTANLVDPIHYLLQIGGKRIRPILTLMSSKLFGGKTTDALSQALAVEVFHNFTLMHDDIMDNSPLRRGAQTVHEKWDINTAILSGDGMMIQAYALLQKNANDKFALLFERFNTTAWEVCVGQQMDMDFEKRTNVSKEEYIEMIRLKTAVLLGCALELGAIQANASKKDQEHIRKFGEYVGISFQLRDDYLDTFGKKEEVGKRIGGDILADKKTFLYLHAIETGTSSDLELLRHFHGSHPNDQEKIASITAIFESTQADQEILKKSEAYYQKAIQELNHISTLDEQKNELRALAAWLLERHV